MFPCKLTRVFGVLSSYSLADNFSFFFSFPATWKQLENFLGTKKDLSSFDHRWLLFLEEKNLGLSEFKSMLQFIIICI